MILHEPLISVVVITYNSSKYVLETLNSIREQTYSNLELIISDDYSKDDTVIKCQEWVKKNVNRFIRTQIITHHTNTGIAANINRGYKAANGEWIKSIAGDDALDKECISKYVEFINNHPNASICHSKYYCYNNTFEAESLVKDKELIYPSCFESSNPDSNKQFLFLCLSNIISAPTIFMKKSLFDSVGDFDEDIPMCEDYPMWLKITRNGYPFYFLDSYTTLYRIHTSSIFGANSVNYLFKCFFKYDNDVYNKYIKFFCPLPIRFTNRYDYYLRLCLHKLNFSKPGSFSKVLYSSLRVPYRLLFKGIMCYYGINKSEKK